MRKRRQQSKLKIHRPTTWAGPLEDGVTQSLLSDYLVCNERFRLKVVEGLDEDEGFRLPIEYGCMWHEAEEQLALGKSRIVALAAIKQYETKIKRKYPSDIEEITVWARYCREQFSVYYEYYKENPAPGDTIVAEVPFRVPYTLPSGRQVTLRGKIDRLYLIPPQRKGRSPTLILQDNKVKGQMDPGRMGETLFHNLQLCFYAIAVKESIELFEDDWYIFNLDPDPLEGWFICEGSASKKPLTVSQFQYNLIKRPLSERYPVRQRKAESKDDFTKRVIQTIRDSPEDYFTRPAVVNNNVALQKFQDRILNPMLESLCDWWEWILVDPSNPWREGNHCHWQTPWGVYNAIYNEFKGSYYDYLVHGRTFQLETSNLFPELS